MNAILNILYAFWNILEHSRTFWNSLEQSGTVWNSLELYRLHTLREFQIGTHTDRRTDGQTLGLVELRLRS